MTYMNVHVRPHSICRKLFEWVSLALIVKNNEIAQSATDSLSKHLYVHICGDQTIFIFMRNIKG